MAWRNGLKAIAIYRDGSKSGQPVSVTKETTNSLVLADAAGEDPNWPPAARRHRLNDDRTAVTHKFSIGGHEGYLTVGLYPNGKPGEIFIRMSKQGSTINGLMEMFATMFSVSLQHGVPMEVLCGKMAHTSFEPSGWTGNEKMGYAKSIGDYTRALAAAPFSRRRTARALCSHLLAQRDYLYRQQQAGRGSCGAAVRRCSHLPDLWLNHARIWHMLYVPLMQQRASEDARSSLWIQPLSRIRRHYYCNSRSL